VVVYEDSVQDSVQVGDPSIDTLDIMWIGNNMPVDPPAGVWTNISSASDPATCWVNPELGKITFENPSSPDYAAIAGSIYKYKLFLTGDDHPEERRFTQDRPLSLDNQKLDRAQSWRMAIEAEHDQDNLVSDGGIIDNINAVTRYVEGESLFAIDEDGVWRITVDVFVPTFMPYGPETMISYLRSTFPELIPDLETATRVMELATPNFGMNTVSAVMRDATNKESNPNRCRYTYYSDLRVPEIHGDGDFSYEGSAELLSLDRFCAESELFQKQFYICLVGGSFIYPPLLEEDNSSLKIQEVGLVNKK